MEQPDDPEQREKWLRLPFIGIGISQQVKPLVDGSVLTAAVIKSLTMEFTLTLLVRAIETQAQLPERSVVEALSYPDLEKKRHSNEGCCAGAVCHGLPLPNPNQLARLAATSL